jgi:hypothetical protein
VVKALAASATEGNVLYAAPNRPRLSSRVAPVRAGAKLPQPLDYMPYALLTDPAAPGHLYAGLSNRDMWHTEDDGEVQHSD